MSVYLKAAKELVRHEKATPNDYACWTIEKVGGERQDFEYVFGSRKALANAEKGSGYWGYWGPPEFEENRFTRSLALLFMHEIERTGL